MKTQLYAFLQDGEEQFVYSFSEFYNAYIVEKCLVKNNDGTNRYYVGENIQYMLDRVGGLGDYGTSLYFE